MGCLLVFAEIYSYGRLELACEDVQNFFERLSEESQAVSSSAMSKRGKNSVNRELKVVQFGKKLFTGYAWAIGKGCSG